MQKELSNSEQLVSLPDVQHAIAQQARDINAFIASLKMNQQEDVDVVALCLLNGGIIYSGMLLPMLDFKLALDSISVSRYGENDFGGALTWHASPRTDLSNKVVLLLDDIFDQGVTLAHVEKWCKAQGARQVCSCVLAWKKLTENGAKQPDFYALQIPDKFVVGMGMDYAGLYRNAPGVYVLPEKNK